MAFCKNAQEFTIINHQQRSNIFFEHDLERLIHRDLGGNRIDCVALCLNNISDLSHKCTGLRVTFEGKSFLRKNKRFRSMIGWKLEYRYFFALDALEAINNYLINIHT